MTKSKSTNVKSSGKGLSSPRAEAIRKSPPGHEPQTLLVVDRSGETERQLRESWRQLHLENTLKIVKTRKEGLGVLQEIALKRNWPQVAAIILDPETTEEETGIFMREVRLICKRRPIPVFLWTRNEKTYNALEGKGASKVVQKPGVLQLIHRLHEAGLLRVSSFHPHKGGTGVFSLCL